MDNSTRGRHLLVTGFVAAQAADLLDDPEGLAALLSDVVAAADMKVLSPPKMVKVPLDLCKANSPDDCGGVTGTVILSTSHGSIHTWPLHLRFSFDLYSCHDFDAERVLGLLGERLLMTGGQVIDVDRTPNEGLRNEVRRLQV